MYLAVLYGMLLPYMAPATSTKIDAASGSSVQSFAWHGACHSFLSACPPCDHLPDEELQRPEYDDFHSDFLPDSENEASSDSEVEIWSKQPRKDGPRGALPGEAARLMLESADMARLLAKEALIDSTFHAAPRQRQKNHDLWVDRFETFRREGLQVREFVPKSYTGPNSGPTADEIRQFSSTPFPGLFKDVDQVNIIRQQRGPSRTE
ncbi:unnamed protein product [Clonostachys solani]|uniref:Uncharacterized protein n=1 Tax=Clonostachys solani TaxID=160281 RepID=A0A9N9Z2G8_9HYPO|nr:unnamed protein product [Clonostachys solani]